MRSENRTGPATGVATFKSNPQVSSREPQRRSVPVKCWLIGEQRRSRGRGPTIQWARGPIAEGCRPLSGPRSEAFDCGRGEGIRGGIMLQPPDTNRQSDK
jgi:hypothetical protein